MASYYKRDSGFAAAWTLVGVFVVVVVVGVLGVVTGYAYAGVKAPAQLAVLNANVCRQSDVEKYNSLTSATNGQAGDRTAFIKSIKDRHGYDADATCVFMLAQSYIMAKDTDSARTMVDTLHKLADKGNYADPRLVDLTSLNQLDATLRATNTSDTAPMGEG